MPTYEPVDSLADLDELDIDEMAEGYDAGARGEGEPDINHTRAYWHGWREYMIDAGRMKPDAAHKQLTLERQTQLHIHKRFP